MLLHFGAVDYRAMVWVNGRFVGRHEGGGVPFLFDITRELAGANNRVRVRAEDPPTDKSIPRGKQYWELKSKSIFYTRTSGIWQPVWLEATGAHRLDYVHVTANQNGDAEFHGALDAIPAEPLRVSIDILDGGSVVAHTDAATDEDRFNATLHVTNPKRWSPDVSQPVFGEIPADGR